jgi:predicted ATPase/DNA-binding winged helix-turn-helix (wHTH) protein
MSPDLENANGEFDVFKEGYRFEDYSLFPCLKCLFKGGKKVHLSPTAIRILIILVERRGEIVTKDHLIELVWMGRPVDENNLAIQIGALRRVLGSRAIKTVYGLGYQFTVAVTGFDGSAEKRIAIARAVDMIPKTNLPRPLATLFGREADLIELEDCLKHSRLVTLTGPGGVGKTRLAIELGWAMTQQYPEGVWLIDVAPLTDRASIWSGTATTLGVGLPDAGSAAETIAAAIGKRRQLLIFDNCEYLAGATAAVCTELLHRVHGLSILTTSQVVLGVVGGHDYRLYPLALPPPNAAEISGFGATDLFVERARAADQRFRVDARNAFSVAAICRGLEGIPLALELAASRIGFLGLEGLRARIDQQLGLFGGEARTGDGRHRSLRAVVEWSYGLLADAERQFYCRLAVFPTSFTLEGAVAVAGTGSEDMEGIEILGRLVDKSLVSVAAETSPRYRLLETLRLFASEQLKTNGEQDTVAERHVRHYVEYFDQADLEWQGMPDAAWKAVYAPELDNVRAALDWALADPARGTLAVALAARVGRLWYWLGLATEGRHYIDRAADLLEKGTCALDAARLLWLQSVAWRDSDRKRAMRSNQEAIVLFRQVDDSERLGLALNNLANDYFSLGRLDDAIATLDEAWRLLKHSRCDKGRAFIKILSSSIAGRVGNISKAKEHLLELLDQTKKENYPLIWCNANINLGEYSFLEGNLAIALEYVTEAVQVGRTLINASLLYRALTNLATYLALSDSATAAHRHASEALPLAEQQSAYWLRALLELCALLFAIAGQHREAAELEGFVDAAYEMSCEERQFTEQRVQSRLLAILTIKFSREELLQWYAVGSPWTAGAAIEFTIRKMTGFQYK